MKLLFFLSGSNTSFASEEVISLLGAYNIKYELIFAEGQFLIIDVNHLDLSFIFRLGLTHFVLNVIIESNIYEEVEKITSKIEWDSYLDLDRTFKVRVKQKGNCFENLELIIAKSISNYFEDKIKADLTKPMDEIIGILYGNKLIIGKKIFERNKKDFNKRKPQLRPFFSPTSIDPRIARAMINVSQAKKEVLDPFTGTGGILIEAGLLGLDIYGIDIEERSVIGTRTNLLNYGINQHDIKLGDARKIHDLFDRCFESIVTDAPYGRSTKIDKDKDKMYRDSFISIFDSFKKRCVIGLNREYPFEEIGFSIESVYKFRVHKSLTRHLYILSK
ncbi:MAG: N-6 DNA methylase [Candidatus Methanofastidiosa archaeon]|jgi:tRNA (guanine10-N2)-dimethyltransferase|nr:N-6 DNA methylase [Candidatus Methanofastidiosa archaeon]